MSVTDNHADTGNEENHGYDYDVAVIGGGSGGLAFAKRAGELGKKTVLLDFVNPSPQGTKWGLGGTCVNVGCIPKKLFHTAALLGEKLNDARSYGWAVPQAIQHSWEDARNAIDEYIRSLNWGYRVQLKDKSVEYVNAVGRFLDPHTLETTDKKGKKGKITARRFVIAVGGRPVYPEFPGAREHCVTSDDIFQLDHPPGNTLCVGASYVALECAGFIHGLGFPTTVMMRSIPLRGFDQQMASMIVKHMTSSGINFLQGAVPTEVVKTPEGKLLVSFSNAAGEKNQETFDTVMVATGRKPETDRLNLDAAGVVISKGGKLVANNEQTNVPHIYAVGDILEGRPELTPSAIQAGHLLANRLYAGSKTLMNYDAIPTTVFTPLEYGLVGLSEEEAVSRYGDANIEIYHSHWMPLEFTLPHHPDNQCYMKVVCHLGENSRVLGMHFLGPNAGEVIQGFGLAVKLRATKADLDDLVGIHPTNAEYFTTMKITKRSGESPELSGC